MALTDITKQVRMVFDLNKCLGCHTCSMACKTMWTDRNKGQQYMYWNNVETQPGRGYPRNYDKMGGGWNVNDPTYTSGLKEPLTSLKLNAPVPKIVEDYGAAWEYEYEKVLMTSGGNATKPNTVPIPEPKGPTAYSSNWDEDVATGVFPNSFYFYLPRICNHCTTPACLAACPRKAIYKREEDGIVLVDQDRCRGYRYCVKACPYKKVYFNMEENKSQKCIACYPRLQQETAAGYTPGAEPPRVNFCFNQCPGRIRFVGYAKTDTTTGQPDSGASLQANVNRLIALPAEGGFGVALRLHPEWGTEPNLFYVPPLSPPGFKGSKATLNGGEIASGTLDIIDRIPVDFLAWMFGDNAKQTHAERVERIKFIFETLKREKAKGTSSELMKILNVHSESDRLQTYLG